MDSGVRSTEYGVWRLTLAFDVLRDQMLRGAIPLHATFHMGLRRDCHDCFMCYALLLYVVFRKRVERMIDWQLQNVSATSGRGSRTD